MPDFRVASDIGKRLAELRELLGENQREFAARFGRGWKQVSMWERGHQRPRPSVLGQAASRNGWPSEIFSEGGPMPATVVNRPVNVESGPHPERSPGRRAEDRANHKLALASRLAFLRDQLRAYQQLGEPPSPETIEEWLRLTADVMDATRLSDALTRNGTPPAGDPPAP